MPANVERATRAKTKWDLPVIAGQSVAKDNYLLPPTLTTEQRDRKPELI